MHAQHATGGAGFDAAPPPAFFADATPVTLTPGSVLYVPAGMWHRVECEADSVSINVSLMGLLWADLVADAVRLRGRRGPGRSCAPKSVTSASWKQAVASAAHPRVRSRRGPPLGTHRHLAPTSHLAPISTWHLPPLGTT